MKYMAFSVRVGSKTDGVDIRWEDGGDELEADTPEEAVLALSKMNRREYTMALVPLDAFVIVRTSVECTATAQRVEVEK